MPQPLIDDEFSLTEQGKKNVDVDLSGDISNKDALAIQQYRLGIIKQLPVT